MSDPQNPESGSEPAIQGLPIPKIEGASTASPTSGVDMEALAEKVAAKLRPDFEKVAQSTKDKRIAAIEKKLGTVDLAELEQMGVPITEGVKTEYRFRQLEKQLQTELPSQSQPPASKGNGAELTANDVSEVMQRFKLDANDAEVLEKLRGTYENRYHFEATMANVALARANKTTPTPAATTTLSGSAGKTVMNEAQAEVKYGELGDLLRNPTLNAAKIKALTTELEEAGYKV